MQRAKVDDRGRVQLPSNLRHRMKLEEGDEFVAEELGEDTIILKKINLRVAAGRCDRESQVHQPRSASKERSRRRATNLQERSSRYILDNCVFIAAVTRGWTKSTGLVYHLLDLPAELLQVLLHYIKNLSKCHRTIC